MQVLRFGRFRFDAKNERLEDELGPIRLNPKAFAVLAMLIERRGQLVVKEDLLDAVWRDTHVADGVLKVSVAEIRAALGDSAAQPRFIETVHRRGYRFIASAAEVARTDWVRSPIVSASLIAWPAGGSPALRSSTAMVGRARETRQLEQQLARALGGDRQVVFVTGEPGAGKTTLLEHFVIEAAGRQILLVTGGQSLELFGAPEPYAPMLDAVSRLVRDCPAARPLLRRYAPTCFAQLPWLVEDADRDGLGRELIGAAGERMLREMAEFVDILSAEAPLVLVLEDLHWSDSATLDLVSLLASRREPARVLLVASHRPGELAFGPHPLRAVVSKLIARGEASEIALDDLDAAAAGEYLIRRFPGHRFPVELADLLSARADGNPLFMVTLVDHLVACGAIPGRQGHAEAIRGVRDALLAVPETVRMLIDSQLERLPRRDRELLEGASLVGLEFSAAAAAAGANRSITDAERSCEVLGEAGTLVRRNAVAEWPDGTVSGCYTFRHALHREVLAAAVSPARRREAQLGVGRALERAYAERAVELAAELAFHFEVGGDRVRAAHFHRLAAETAARRFSFVEAERHLDKALELLGEVPPSRQREHEEFLLQSALGPVRRATRGDGAPEVERAYARALELAGETSPAAAFPILWGLWNVSFVRAELGRALELAERNRSIAEASGDPVLRLEAHQALWATHFFRGDWEAMRRHLDQGEPLYDPADRPRYADYRHDPKASALGLRSHELWAIGRIDEALAVVRQAVAHARTVGEPMSIALAMTYSAWVRLFRREPEACREEAEALIDYASEQFLRFCTPFGLQLRGWALVELAEIEAGIADLEQSLELADAMGTRQGRSHQYANLAYAYSRAGRFAEARELIERSKAFMAATGERYDEPDVLRLDAELTLASAGGAKRADPATREQAEGLLHFAIESARSQGSRTLELRAATARARLLQGREGAEPARAQLRELLGVFAEGHATQDLREATELVAGS